MAETIEDVERSRSWMPLAMTAAFVVGAGVAGWFVFRDDLQAWARVEDLAWTPAAGERLTILQHDRLRRVVSGEPDRVVGADTEWTVVPSAAARVPGQPSSWTQTLRGGGWEIRDGDVVLAAGALAPPDPTAEPTRPEAPDPVVPSAIGPLGALVALDLGIALDGPGVTAASATPTEVLEQIETRRSGVPVEEREPLDPLQSAALHADLAAWGQRLAFDAAACLPGDLYRPGQTWAREAALPIGEWGTHVLRLELRHDGYDGDRAVVRGTLARKPAEEALSAEDGLSGLKGEIECRYDIAAKRVVEGRYNVEARGKSGRKFATLGIDHAWALAGPTQIPTIPADLDLAPLPPPAEPPPPEP